MMVVELVPNEDESPDPRVLLSIDNPLLTRVGGDYVQIVVTIENAVAIRAALNGFLVTHGVQAN